MTISHDSYIMGICDAVMTNCKCPSRSIGVVITQDRHIISTGYNGPPSGFPHPGSPQFVEIVTNPAKAAIVVNLDEFDCPRKALGIPSGERLSLCPCAHAESNAIAAAARNGHATYGAILYINTCVPCIDCARAIINSGIAEVVVKEYLAYPQEGFTGKLLLEECGVKIRVADMGKGDE